MVIEQNEDAFDTRRGQPANQCLVRMAGPHAAVWKGIHVAHGFKYRYSDEVDKYYEEDRELKGVEGERFPLIALDLDTTSLGSLVAYFSWHARMEKGKDGAFHF